MNNNWHVQLDCYCLNSLKYNKFEQQKNLGDLVEKLRKNLFNDKDLIYQIFGINNFSYVHGIQNGICFCYSSQESAVHDYLILLESNYLKELANKNRELQINLTEPWKKWSNIVKITKIRRSIINY